MSNLSSALKAIKNLARESGADELGENFAKGMFGANAKRVRKFGDFFIQMDENGYPKLHHTGVIGVGAMALGGYDFARSALSIHPVYSGGVKKITPDLSEYQDEYYNTPSDANATGDLVFALNKLRVK